MAKRREQEKYDYLVKIVIIGDSAVGKTNILLRYTNEEYKVTHITTIGVDFKIKTINIDGIKIKMQIWDTAGQQRFKTVTETYYKGAAGVVLVYSVNDRKTFQSLENWMKQLNQSQPQKTCKLIVGNKCDVADNERQVSYQEGKKLADQYGVRFVQSSAKQNTNISQIFSTIGKDIKDCLLKSDNNSGPVKKPGDSIKIKQGDDNKEKKKSCEC